MEAQPSDLRSSLQRTRAAWPFFFAYFLRTPGMGDLTCAELGVVSALDAGERDAATIASVLGRPRAELDAAVDRLARRGLVAAGPKHRLTAAGKALVDSMIGNRAEAMEEMMSRLGPAERDELMRLFTSLTRAVETVSRQPAPA